MALIGNHSVINKSHARFSNGAATTGTATTGALFNTMYARSNFNGPSLFRSRDIYIPKKESFPGGYEPGTAFIIARSNGGLGAHTTIQGTGAITATLWEVKLAIAALHGTGQISDAALSVLTQGAATLAGVGTISNADMIAVSSVAAALSGQGLIVSANLSAIVPIATTLTGVGTITANLTGIGSLSALIEIGGTNFVDSGTVWDQLTNEHVASGSFGLLVQKLLTVAKFLGLK